MYVSLDDFIDYEKLNDLNNYLNQINIYNFNCVNFVANNKKHGNAIQLTDTINWDSKFGFRESRLYRGNPHCNKLNENSVVLHKLTKFIYNLPFFKHIGCICIILNEPNVEGSEHCDHMFDDIVSEFVWLRTENKKRFFVRDNQGNKHYINNNCIWFDDHFMHNITPISEPCFSIRIDGKFNDKFRNYIANQNKFKKSIFKQVLLNPQ